MTFWIFSFIFFASSAFGFMKKITIIILFVFFVHLVSMKLWVYIGELRRYLQNQSLLVMIVHVVMMRVSKIVLKEVCLNLNMIQTGYVQEKNINFNFSI